MITGSMTGSPKLRFTARRRLALTTLPLLTFLTACDGPLDYDLRGQIGGFNTTAAAQAAPRHIADAYGIERRNYYYAIADARPASRKYAATRAGGKGGWITRAEAFIAPRYHLTASQHRERTAKWA